MDKLEEDENIPYYKKWTYTLDIDIINANPISEEKAIESLLAMEIAYNTKGPYRMHLKKITSKEKKC